MLELADGVDADDLARRRVRRLTTPTPVGMFAPLTIVVCRAGSGWRRFAEKVASLAADIGDGRDEVVAAAAAATKRVLIDPFRDLVVGA